MDWLKFFNDPSMTMLLVCSIIAIVVLVAWHRADDEFDLRQFLVDPATGKLSVYQLGILTALGVSSWGFISQIQDGKRTEFYFNRLYDSLDSLRRSY